MSSDNARSRPRDAGRRAGPRTFAAVAFAAALGLAACGSDSESGDTTPTTVVPATTVAAATTVAPATTAAPTTVADETTTSVTEPTSEACPEYTDKPDLPLELCDKGDKVLEVQEGLVDAGYEIVVDGFFGNQTRGAVQQFQADNGLEVDGIVGPLTFGKLFPTE